MNITDLFKAAKDHELWQAEQVKVRERFDVWMEALQHEDEGIAAASQIKHLKLGQWVKSANGDYLFVFLGRLIKVSLALDYESTANQPLGAISAEVIGANGSPQMTIAKMYVDSVGNLYPKERYSGALEIDSSNDFSAFVVAMLGGILPK